MDQDGTWHGGGPRSRPHCARWVPSSPPQKGAFSAHFYCGQMVGCIMIPLGTEVGLGLGDIVLDGDPAPPSLKGQSSPPQLSANVHCSQTAGWTKMPLGMDVALAQAILCSVGTQLPLPEKRAQPPPNFWSVWPMSIVAKRLDGSRCHLVRR